MRILLLLLFSLTTGLVTSAQQPAATSTVDGATEQVLGVQDALIAAYIHHDIASLDRILADEYTFTEDVGIVLNKKQIMESFKAGGDRQITSYKRQDDKVRVYGDFAVLTYRYQSIEKFNGRDDSGDFRLTRIFLKRDGRWQIVCGHESRVAGSELNARNRLIGTWRVVSGGTFLRDGSFEPFPEYGAHPIGYLIYDPSGRMCVSLSNPDHPHWANSEKPTDAERLRSYDAFFAYCGSYEVREKEGRVIHRPQMGSWPHYIGTDQSRNFHLEGDRLTLSDEETPPGGERRRYQIIWERVIKQDK
jgi:Lipocalin-like domain/Domain of unknown function (DUF4440)